MMKKATNAGSKLVVERLFNAAPETIFSALTEIEKLRSWFYPKPDGWSVEVVFSAIVGEDYKLVMIDPTGKKYEHKGKIKEVKKNKKLAFTWSSHVVNDTLVTILLDKTKKGTRMTLTHDFLPEDERDGHREGWLELFDQLDILINRNKR